MVLLLSQRSRAPNLVFFAYIRASIYVSAITAIQSPSLTNVQLELLKAFSHQLSDRDLAALRLTLDLFFAERLIQQADAAWDQQGWDDAKVDALLATKMRASKH